MKVNAYLVVALSVGAYLVGREVAKRSSVTLGRDPRLPPPLPSLDHPLPPPPVVEPGMESVPVPGAQASWDAVMFDVDLFPAHADRSVILPPWNSSVATASTTCDAIAVGEDWWDMAAAQVTGLVDEGVSVDDALDQTLSEQLPERCADTNVEAYLLLRDELEERLVLGAAPFNLSFQATQIAGAPGWDQPEPQGPGNWGPQSNPAKPPLMDSLMSFVTGYRPGDA